MTTEAVGTDTAMPYRANREAELAAGKAIGCVPTNVGIDIIDELECSCGWKSQSYMDGAEYAQQEWVRHIKSKGVVLELPFPGLVKS